jgi:two-component system response regulator AtoC
MSDDQRTQKLEEVVATPAGDVLLALWEDRTASIRIPDRGAVVVGRLAQSSAVTLVVDHPSVSRQHARIDVESGALFITDLESANGTKVQGTKLARGEKAPIGPGVLVEVGVAVLVVQRRSAPNVAPPHGEATREKHPLGIIVPANGPMAQVHRLVEHVASSNLSVLILGETGSGKEVIAESIHRFSKRSKGPFVRLNCAALPENLLESELFGHEKGAFTGAIATKLGLVEAADGGTIFLDEMGEMPLGTQAKLLRVLESHEVQRVGALKPKKVDIRIVAATNVDLEAAVKKGTFRLDLFHRLDGVSIALPPLRARKSEIPLLARLFLRRACEAEGRPIPSFTPEAERALEGHAWPGNVRELKNVVERAAVLSMGAPITPAHLRLTAVAAEAAAPIVDPGERDKILAVLDRCGGNQSRAARELGIPRRTLLRRLDEYGVPRPRK